MQRVIGDDLESPTSKFNNEVDHRSSTLNVEVELSSKEVELSESGMLDVDIHTKSTCTPNIKGVGNCGVSSSLMW